MNQIITLNLDGACAVPNSSLTLSGTLIAHNLVREVLFIPTIVTGGHYSIGSASFIFKLPAEGNNMSPEDLF